MNELWFWTIFKKSFYIRDIPVCVESLLLSTFLSTQRHVYQKCFISDRSKIINGTQTFGQKSYKLRRKSILEHLKSVHAVMARHDPYTPQIPHPNPKLWSLHGRSWAIRVFVGEKLLLILTSKYYISFYTFES